MKVILTKDIAGLGRAGDIKEVSDGHARNLLLPKHLALPATTSVMLKAQKELKEQQEKILRLQANAQELKNKLSAKTFTVAGKAQKQHLFAAIHEQQIADLINHKLHTELTPQQIKIPKPIKSIGLHDIEIKLSETLKANAKIEVKAAEQH